MFSLRTDPSLDALRDHRLVEVALAQLVRATRILPLITAKNAATERVRLQRALQAGEDPVPCFEYPVANKGALPSARTLDRLRVRVERLAGASLYLRKLDELELDMALYAAVGDARLLRPLAARRFGTGRELVTTVTGTCALHEHALRLVGLPAPEEEPRVVPAQAELPEASLAQLIIELAAQVGLHVQVRVEPNLAAGAATGDRTVYVAARKFGVREAQRLAAHEVLGHLTSAENGRAQPLRLVEWGTAESFADQEGVALCVEEQLGLLDQKRLRSLGGRVLATAAMHEGASFGDTARTLHHEHGFSAMESITLCERAYRGGGVARDASYLHGYLQVRTAIDAGDTTLDELRMGRVSVSALPALRELMQQGLVRAPFYRPNFSRSFFPTSSGTMPRKSPPSAAASLMSVELT